MRLSSKQLFKYRYKDKKKKIKLIVAEQNLPPEANILLKLCGHFSKITRRQVSMWDIEFPSL